MLKFFKNLVALRSYNQQLEDETANQINFDCDRIEGCPVFADTDLQFTNIGVWSVNDKFFWKNFYWSLNSH